LIAGVRFKITYQGIRKMPAKPYAKIRKSFGSQMVKYYFAVLLMTKSRKTYNVLQLASAIVMILALLWLTVSTPFVYASQQELVKQNKNVNYQSPLSGTEEEGSNPFGNTTEEKNPNSSTSFSEEYLHDHHLDDYFFSIISHRYKFENAGTYIAFHGEVQVPPPNVA